jgi:chaperonin GroEL
MFLTTEAVIVEEKEEHPAGGPPQGMGGGMPGMM